MNFSRLTPGRLSELDAQLAPSDIQWDRFYADRERPCPFFVASPDESLAQWVGSGRIAPGRALDIGCGHGRNAVYLARQGFEVEALDLSATRGACTTSPRTAATSTSTWSPGRCGPAAGSP